MSSKSVIIFQRNYCLWTRLLDAQSSHTLLDKDIGAGIDRNTSVFHPDIFLTNAAQLIHRVLSTLPNLWDLLGAWMLSFFDWESKLWEAKNNIPFVFVQHHTRIGLDR